MKAIQITHTGDPSVLTLADMDDPKVSPGHVLVKVAAAGVNYIDTYQRSGLYPVPTPYIPGLEGAGEVLEVGEGVTHVKVGDSIGWASTLGSYAQLALVNAHDAYVIKDGINHTTVAAVMLQGLTAHYLSASVYPLSLGDVALIHAGAGGVGLLLTQMAKARGATVITTTSSGVKAELSRGAGADHVIRYDQLADMTTDLPVAVRNLTDGEGAHVVFDGVGAATFDGSLACLRVRGMMVLFGAASGPVPPFDLQRLNRGGSLTITRPSMGHFLATPEERAWRARDIFDAVRSGNLNVHVGATYTLGEAADAHRALEGRATTGKVLLTP